MIVDVKWMEDNFRKCNDLYFGGVLPLPDFAISKSRTQLGLMSCKRRTGLWGKKKYSEFLIKLSSYYDMTERQAQNVLIHEMIHYYIAFKGMRDTSPHGRIFCSMADSMNEKFGWEITISTRTKGWKVAEDSENKKRQRKTPLSFLILAIKMKDGKCFLSRVNPKSYHIINAHLSHVIGAKECKWYISKNTFFASFPAVRSLRGRLMSADDYERYVSEMVEYS